MDINFVFYLMADFREFDYNIDWIYLKKFNLHLYIYILTGKYVFRREIKFLVHIKKKILEKFTLSENIEGKETEGSK